MEKEKIVKICPIVSNTEIAFTQNPLSKEPKLSPKFAPMGCLGNVCKFFNEQTKECIFVIQTVMISNITNKLFEKEIKESK